MNETQALLDRLDEIVNGDVEYVHGDTEGRHFTKPLVVRGENVEITNCTFTFDG